LPDLAFNLHQRDQRAYRPVQLQCFLGVELRGDGVIVVCYVFVDAAEEVGGLRKASETLHGEGGGVGEVVEGKGGDILWGWVRWVRGTR
jgi:hypothetical protein